MSYDPDVHHRRSIRLRGFDYSQFGSYFVTLVTYKRECLFGEISNDQVKLSLAGQCAESLLKIMPDHFPIKLDAWVVMPNHVHFLITIIEGSQNKRLGEEILKEPAGTIPRSLSAVIQNYKSLTARRIHKLVDYSDQTIWQRNYFEHIVRGQTDFDRIADYIQNNPLDWKNDDLNLLV